MSHWLRPVSMFLSYLHHALPDILSPCLHHPSMYTVHWIWWSLRHGRFLWGADLLHPELSDGLILNLCRLPPSLPARSFSVTCHELLSMHLLRSALHWYHPLHSKTPVKVLWSVFSFSRKLKDLLHHLLLCLLCSLMITSLLICLKIPV